MATPRMAAETAMAEKRILVDEGCSLKKEFFSFKR
jgi:hypothetical protein